MDRINYRDRSINRSGAFEPTFAAERDEEAAGRDESLLADRARFGPQVIEFARSRFASFSAHKHTRLLKNSFGPSKTSIDERRISNLERQSVPKREPWGTFSTDSHIFGQGRLSTVIARAVA